MENSIEELQASCNECHLSQEMKNELCYICATQHMMNGKWKLLILWALRSKVKRFSELQREIPKVKQGPLTAQLKELCDSGFIFRKSYNEVPPRVEYGLTPKGESFLCVLNQMDTWAKEYLFH